MKEFILQRGWKYVGTCGCTPKMDEYKNDNYPGWQIKLGTGNFSFRKFERIWHTKASGNLNQLENVYGQYFQ